MGKLNHKNPKVEKSTDAAVKQRNSSSKPRLTQKIEAVEIIAVPAAKPFKPSMMLIAFDKVAKASTVKIIEKISKLRKRLIELMPTSVIE